MRAVAIFLSLGLVALLGMFANAVANPQGDFLLTWINTPVFLPLVGGRPDLTPNPTPTSTGLPTRTLTLAPTLTLTPSPTVDPARLPDLEPISYGFRYDDPCPWESPGEGWAWVKNSGELEAGLFSVFFDISEGGTVIPVPGLAPSATVEVRMALQHGPPNMVKIVADFDREIIESNEINNTLVLMFTAPPSCTPTGTITP